MDDGHWRPLLRLLLSAILFGSVTAVTNCAIGLGLEDGTVPDSNFTSYPETGDAAGARYNSADSAWCVDFANFTGDEASVTVDLGIQRYISGVLTQGPPAVMMPAEYTNWMQLAVDYSDDGVSWTRCCPYIAQQQTTTFFINHGVSTNEHRHGFGELHRARHVRFAFLTARAMGNNQKCFRLEVLGCPKNWSPETTITHVPHREGWEELQWTEPMVTLYNTEQIGNYSLPVSLYHLNISSGDGDGDGMLATTNRRWQLVAPLWGGRYSVTVQCELEGVVSVCGRRQITAGSGCDLDSDCSTDTEFQLPAVLSAAWSPNGTLHLAWTLQQQGWRTAYWLLAVTAQTGAVVSQVISSSASRHDVTDISSDVSYDVYISPIQPQLQSVPNFQRRIEFIPIGDSSDGTPAPVGVLVADVGLMAAAMWSGQLNITWRSAAAVLSPTTESATAAPPAQLAADGYWLTVTSGRETVWRAAVETTQALWPGLEMGREHVVTVQCQFGDRNVSCGRTVVVPSLQGSVSESNADWLVHDLSGGRVTWSEAEDACRRRGGHLASVTSLQQHDQLAAILLAHNMDDAWIGLDMCQQGTALWTDGTSLQYEAFDPTGSSHSSADQCCVRLERRWPGSMGYVWREHLCDAPATPLCAGHIPTDAVASPVSLTAESNEPFVLELNWSLAQPITGWRPTSHLITICTLRDLMEPETDLGSDQCTTVPSPAQPGARLQGLLGFHEFSISVVGQMIAVPSAGETSVTARTQSALPIHLRLSQQGRLSAVWQRQVVLGAQHERHQVDVLVRRLPSALTQPPASVIALSVMLGDAVDRPALSRLPGDEVRRQTAADIHWSGLELGAPYRLELYEVGQTNTTDYVEFKSYPTCESGQFQLENRCFWPSTVSGMYGGGTAQCANESSITPQEGAVLAPILSPQELWLAEGISELYSAALWVGLGRKYIRASLRQPVMHNVTSTRSIATDSPLSGAFWVPAEDDWGALVPSTHVPPVVEVLRQAAGADNSEASMVPKAHTSHPDAELIPEKMPTGTQSKPRPGIQRHGPYLPPQSRRTLPYKTASSAELRGSGSGTAADSHQSVIVFPNNADAEPVFAEELYPDRSGSATDREQFPALPPAEPGVGAEQESTECRWVEERAGHVFVSSECHGPLPYMCRSLLRATAPHWSMADIAITPRSSWIRLDWRVPESWRTNYLVTVRRRDDTSATTAATARLRRHADAVSVIYQAPPVLLRNLTENAIYEVTLVRRSAGLETTLGPIAIRALDPPRSMFPADDTAHLFVSMSYILVITASLITLILIILANMRVVDCVAHGCLAFCLCVGYTVLLLANGGPLSEAGLDWCRVAAVATQLTFVTALAATTLQAVVTPHLLLARQHAWLQRHAWTVPLLVLLPQTLVVLVTALTARHSVVDGQPQTCWLEMNASSPVLWVQVVHLLVLWLVGMAYIVRALQVPVKQVVSGSSDVKIFHSDAFQQRHRSLLHLRYLTLALLLALPCCWALGAAGHHYRWAALLWPLVVADVLLAALLLARALADAPLRQRLGARCADTYVSRAASSRRQQRVSPIQDTENLLVKRTFHFRKAGPAPHSPDIHIATITD